MITANEFQVKLMRRAKRLLLQGEVERYLNTLKELYALRTTQRGSAA